MKCLIVVILSLLANIAGAQQPADTAAIQQPVVKRARPPQIRPVKKDTTTGTMPDSLNRPVSAYAGNIDTVFRRQFSYSVVLKINPYFNFFAAPESRLSTERVSN